MRTGIAILVVFTLGALAYLQSPSVSQDSKTSFDIDSVHTSVVFRIEHLGVSAFYGRFNQADGGFTVVEGGTGSFDITIDATSVDTANEKRDGHLQSPDFLSVKEFPTITFKGDLKHVEGAKYQAVGTLDLHGVSKPLTVDLTRIGTAEAMEKLRTGFEGSFKISRKAFGIDWRPEALGDEITIMIGVEGTK